MKDTWYKWELLFWLWLAFFFNQADRQIFNVVLPLIKADLQLTDAQLGLVASLFVLVIGLCIPVAGVVGDRFNRKTILCVSLLVWSAATFVTGISTLLWHLIFLRSIAVGGGEAFYAPAANALLGDHHTKSRAVALSIHQTALYAGVVLSGWLGAWLGERYGWKTTFYVFGGVGVGLAGLLMLRLRSAPARATGTLEVPDWRAGIRAFAAEPRAWLLTAAFAGMVLVNVGYLTWMPTFLHEQFRLSLTQAGFHSMFYHHLFAFFGVLLGGLGSDRLARRSARGRLVLQACALLLGVPFIWYMGQSTSLTGTYVALAAFGFCRGVYDANIYATLFDVVAPAYRATSSGLMAMAAFLVGSLSPYLLGVMKPTWGLSGGLSSLSVAYLVAGICVAITWFISSSKKATTFV
ncbi:MFS transporter [Rhabdobacter roseus]|uniref:Sugar phosphate permease n=1 Tax=Rhabdobacter roseus TaxID=1655419 RepID=A0A840TM87_9BACT|nr:MFS transporter [Rhabdobacter roseus]MBB5284045.1 sugar phosphate permease [Rhabdobacter roseus]